jgi:hypothetical protein
LSADFSLLLFGDRFGIYTRKVQDHERHATFMGFEGAWVDALSPNGENILATSAAGELIVVPTRTRSSRVINTFQIKDYAGARWFPDNQRILINGKEGKNADEKVRSYVLDLVRRGPPLELTREGSWGLSIAHDGARVAGVSSDGVRIWNAAGPPAQEGQRVANSLPGDRPVGWTADGQALWIFRRGDIPAQVYRLNIATGDRQPWKEVKPIDPAGVYSILDLEVAPDGSSYFYSYWRMLSELYVVRGLQ